MPELKEAEIRVILEDAGDVIRALAPHCETFDEMLGLIDLAVGAGRQDGGNDAQLRILKELLSKGRQQSAPSQRRQT